MKGCLRLVLLSFSLSLASCSTESTGKEGNSGTDAATGSVPPAVDAAKQDTDSGTLAGDSSWQGTDSGPQKRSGEFTALTYNVAGLPEGISQSNPSVNTPLISPLLNDYDIVLVQEDWLAPEPNPLEGVLDVYHDLLAAQALHPYQSEPAPQPLGSDPRRSEALLSDGLNSFSNFPFGEVTRVAWQGCFGGMDTSDRGAADCLAFKGFSVATYTLSDSVEVEIYNLHAEAGSTEEDQRLSQADFEQLAEFIKNESTGRAVILGGDTNLHTNDGHPEGFGDADTQIWANFLQATGLTDVCEVVSPCENGIDKFAFRGNATVIIEPLSHSFERDKFRREDGQLMSDHDPLAVRFRWSVTP
jgi:hypothetical protein